MLILFLLVISLSFAVASPSISWGDVSYADDGYQVDLILNKSSADFVVVQISGSATITSDYDQFVGDVSSVKGVYNNEKIIVVVDEDGLDERVALNFSGDSTVVEIINPYNNQPPRESNSYFGEFGDDGDLIYLQDSWDIERIYLHCNNGIQDEGETRIDCGGDCDACTANLNGVCDDEIICLDERHDCVDPNGDLESRCMVECELGEGRFGNNQEDQNYICKEAIQLPNDETAQSFIKDLVEDESPRQLLSKIVAWMENIYA